VFSAVVPVAEDLLDRATRLAEEALVAGLPKRRMLVVANPYASTMSDRLRSLVVAALESRYEVEAVDTEARDHATELCREAARERFDLVVAFGGDGTVNEAANGLVGSSTPLTCLPGGATNVLCKTLGIPSDVVQATEHLLALAADLRPRRIDVGRAGERYFVFSSGVGLDASVVRRVDRRPRLKARLGEWYFTYAALTTFARRYLVRPPKVRVRAAGRQVDGVTAVVQNSDPFTYFGRRPIRLCEGAGLDTGTLSAAVLERATPLEVPTLMPRIFSSRPGVVSRHRSIAPLAPTSDLRVTAIDGSFPAQVDGDYLGEFDELAYGVSPRALTVVS
jgi:diacylglycerol kinase family enzyme